MTFWNAEAETLPRERLEALALERMRATLARLGGHAGWRRRLGGVSPHDVKTLDDWRGLPFLTKDDLRDAYPFALRDRAPAGQGGAPGRPPRPRDS